MSKLYQLPSQASHYDDASIWLARLDRGLSDEEQTALQQWLMSNPENRAILIKMATLWDKMDALSCLSDLFPIAQAPAKTLKYPMVMAASFLLIVLIGVWGPVLLPSTADKFLSANPVNVALVDSVYETAVGEHSAVSFADGTEITINTNTKVIVTYSDKYRKFFLERGEIHIDVAHDRLRPLRVFVGGNVVQAIGTAFNVEINHRDQVELIVTNGRVLVASVPEADQMLSTADNDWLPIHNPKVEFESQVSAVLDATEQGTPAPAPLLLTPVEVSKGERFILGSSVDGVEKIELADVEVELSWRQGNLIFRGESLEEAVLEINRYTSVEFVLLDEELKQVRIAGLFKAGDIKGLLETLKGNFDISYQRIGEQKILLSRAN